MMLRGMTWSHPRGYDPLVAAARVWQAETGVEVIWDKRSLQDFEVYPVADLAARYDLIVIDHPHVGQVTRENCLMPLGRPEREAALDALARGSVGPSFQSYFFDGHQWALPIDAASQVLAYRPDMIANAPRSWDEVLTLAKAGRIALPLRPPHSLMCFFTLVAHLGFECAISPERFIDPAEGSEVYDRLLALARLIPAEDFEADPIAVFEKMAAKGTRIAAVPLIYGYVPYSKPGFRARPIRFADIPALPGRGPVGSTLGGTGIAVSAASRDAEAAMDFAFWLASGPVQAGLYAANGGQPGHAAAWEADDVNHAAGSFYRATRATLEGAYVRPRHDGYMGFQDQASVLLTEALRAGDTRGARVIDRLGELYGESFAGVR